VAIIGLRMHVAIADGRQRLDREVEIGEWSIFSGVGDRLMAEGIKEAKYSVSTMRRPGRRTNGCRASGQKVGTIATPSL
jgi:hypothetical protein